MTAKGRVSTWGSFGTAAVLLAGFVTGLLPSAIMILVIAFIIAAVWFAL